MSIIEKLGITPAPWLIFEDKKESKLVTFETMETGERNNYYPVISAEDDNVCIYDSELRLISVAPEILELFIELIDYIEITHPNIATDTISSDDINVIEKATGKTWKEIKELINEGH